MTLTAMSSTSIRKQEPGKSTPELPHQAVRRLDSKLESWIECDERAVSAKRQNRLRAAWNSYYGYQVDIYSHRIYCILLGPSPKSSGVSNTQSHRIHSGHKRQNNKSTEAIIPFQNCILRCRCAIAKAPASVYLMLSNE